MSARERFIDRYPEYAAKRLAAGTSFRFLKRRDHNRRREAAKCAIRAGWEPPTPKRNILYF
jgi:hypothetical protein